MPSPTPNTPPPSQTTPETTYSTILSKIDAAHAEDPTKTTLPSGEQIPYELLYAQKSTAFLTQRFPPASPALRLAVRAQHFRRWEVPRSTYPAGRAGYLTWRAYLKTRQADLVTALCREHDLPEEVTERVGKLMRKEGLKNDEETQVLEDVACLVFLEDQFAEFERAHDEEKIVGILRKTWGKMTARGREMAMGIPMEGRAREVLRKALAG
ncbi:hypothetical protein CC80DRAFT_594097 [Byssothecium circinans]|uniref:Glutamyl-tRNA synthetase n=1 Tax=Byssothecium circinans TaxID=147558 RepID=A0A6A5TW15_9PLEO|nr:hypothetical protein CC80DRAFT_594097 [Byssothecium circinans]